MLKEKTERKVRSVSKIVSIKKRDGTIVPFDFNRIIRAISRAMEASHEGGEINAIEVARSVVKSLNEIKKNLEEEIPKIQQAIINCILFGTYYDNTVLISSDGFINFCCFLIQTLEYSNVIIKMKIILLVII